MAATVTKVQLKRVGRVNLFRLKMTVTTNPTNSASYPPKAEMATDPFHRLILWGTPRYKKAAVVGVQDFLIRLGGAETEAELWQRHLAAAEDTLTGSAAREELEWQFDSSHFSMAISWPGYIMPPGLGVIASLSSISANSELLIDFLMLEASDINDLKPYLGGS